MSSLESQVMNLNKGLTNFTHQVEKEGGENISVCYQCGTCTAVCPTGALYVVRPEMAVAFDAAKCSACELCCPVCPAKAMEVRLDRSAL